MFSDFNSTDLSANQDLIPVNKNVIEVTYVVLFASLGLSVDFNASGQRGS